VLQTLEISGWMGGWIEVWRFCEIYQINVCQTCTFYC